MNLIDNKPHLVMVTPNSKADKRDNHLDIFSILELSVITFMGDFK